MLKALCQMFQEKSPLKSIVIICTIGLSPCSKAKSPEVSTKKFEKLYTKSSIFPFNNVMILKVSTTSFLMMLSKETKNRSVILIQM